MNILELTSRSENERDQPKRELSESEMAQIQQGYRLLNTWSEIPGQAEDG